MPFAGYPSTVKVTGTPTAMVGEACTNLGGNVFQVTASAKRIIDPDAAIVVKDAGVPVPTTNYVLNKLFGKITFSVPPGGAVTVDANYLPTLDVIECKEFSVSNARDLADSTVFKVSPHRTHLALLKDASGSISHLKALLDDLDPGGGTVKLYDLMANGTRKVLELAFGNSGYVWRGWVLFDSQEVAAAFDDLVNASLNWQATLDDSQSALGNSAFGFDLA
jgi:hypothetical protein